MSRVNQLYNIANNLALSTNDFFKSKGAGKGNHSTNRFINELGSLAKEKFGHDFSEKGICGENSLAVDFYFPDEATIAEVALGLKNPNTEYEKDTLKAVMAKSLGNKVDTLVLIAKPGGVKKCNQPGRVAVKKWLKENHSIDIEVLDLG